MGIENVQIPGYQNKIKNYLLINYSIFLCMITFLANYYNYCVSFFMDGFYY